MPSWKRGFNPSNRVSGSFRGAEPRTFEPSRRGVCTSLSRRATTPGARQQVDCVPPSRPKTIRYRPYGGSSAATGSAACSKTTSVARRMQPMSGNGRRLSRALTLTNRRRLASLGRLPRDILLCTHHTGTKTPRANQRRYFLSRASWVYGFARLSACHAPLSCSLQLQEGRARGAALLKLMCRNGYFGRDRRLKQHHADGRLRIGRVNVARKSSCVSIFLCIRLDAAKPGLECGYIA